MIKLCLFFACAAPALLAADPQPSVADYPSIQEALDANPGKVIYVPAGDYLIHEQIRVSHDGTGLCGPGRIIQDNPDQAIIRMKHDRGGVLRDLTLTRAEGRQDSPKEGVMIMQCPEAVVDNVKVIDNRTQATVIYARQSDGVRLSHCLVRNYMRLNVEDRTADKDWGYAFNSIDGTGIAIVETTGALVEGCRVIEEVMVPTPEIQAKYKLGTFVKKNPEKGVIVNQKMWDANYTDAWHQGSGIVINSPTTTDAIRVLGNHVENAAQGLDIHADHVIISQNIIKNAFIGMKAMHGSRNVLITGNQFIKNDLWAIGLMPGAASTETNTDGGTIVSGNIISDFGEGQAHWIWGDGRSPIKFDDGQKPGNPPLTDVIIQGNLIQSLGAPHYRYAVIIPKGPNAPRGLHFMGNLFPPGTSGVANIELPQ